MTTQTEALKLALEALKLGDAVFYPQTSIAIAAIEGVLAQPEHSATHGEPESSLADVIRAEPTELIHKWRFLEIVKDYTTPPQPKEPEQEPVAKYIGECSEGSLVQLYEDVKKGADFYTTPPQRTWEGLSVFEINELVENTEYEDYRGLVEATEAKLKEKNNA